MGSSKSVTLAKFSKAGLGNLLYIWAKGLIFSDLNEMPFYHSSFFKLRIGPVLRKEEKKRFYFGYFRNDLWNGFLFRLKSKIYHSVVVEPPVKNINVPSESKTGYVFTNHCDDPYDGFIQIKNHRELIKKSLSEILGNYVKGIIEESPRPILAVHVRRGDFKHVSWGLTPLEYFIDMINCIRSYLEYEIPVTVFSDGTESELLPILRMPQVKRAENNPDIVDLILMSQSKLLIVSTGSTFSYWSAFLGNMPVILHPDNPHKHMRPDSVLERVWEGPLSPDSEKWPTLFLENLSDIKKASATMRANRIVE